LPFPPPGHRGGGRRARTRRDAAAAPALAGRPDRETGSGLDTTRARGSARRPAPRRPTAQVGVAGRFGGPGRAAPPHGGRRERSRGMIRRLPLLLLAVALLAPAVPVAAQSDTLDRVESLLASGRLTEARATLDRWNQANPPGRRGASSEE